MKNYQIDALELFETDCLLRNPAFIDSGSHPLVVFVAGRAQGDYDDLFLDLELKVHESELSICIPGHDGSYTTDGVRVETGYPGFDAWSSELYDLLVVLDPGSIFSCVVRPGHEKITNTREEAEGFVLCAKKQKWEAANVLAHAHQMPRLMCCLLLATKAIGYPIKLFPMFSEFPEWRQEVHGSLGQVNKQRWEHIAEEFERIQGYIENGWASPLSELKEYLLNPDPLEN